MLVCANLATDPDFRRMGAATKLMKWPFEAADREGVICYLDTDPEVCGILTNQSQTLSDFSRDRLSRATKSLDL